MLTELADAIVGFLTTYHEGGRHGGYGWTYVMIWAGILATALAAREQRARRFRLRERMRRETRMRPMRAAAQVEAEGTSRQLEAHIREGDGAYLLVLREHGDTGVVETTHRFATLEALETFLATSTVFRLGDFRPD